MMICDSDFEDLFPDLFAEPEVPDAPDAPEGDARLAASSPAHVWLGMMMLPAFAMWTPPDDGDTVPGG